MKKSFIAKAIMEEMGGSNAESLISGYSVKHNHAIKIGNTGMADKIAARLKSQLEDMGYDWKSDPSALEMLSDYIDEAEELEEMPKPELSTLAKIKAKKIEDLIKQKAGSQEANDIEAVKAKIERNKEKQAQANAAQKASDLEARLGGKMFADSKNFKGLNVMKESYIKELRMLLENEVEQAGVLMAAKGFSQEIQTMIEKMGRLMNEELGPVVDNMRMAYGQMQAEAFGETMRTDMQGIVDNLLTVKNNIDDAVEELASGQIPQMKNDMDGEGVAMDGDMEGLGDVGDEGGLGDLDQIADDFGGDESMAGPEEEPLGRPKKESIENLKKQLSEMRKQVAKVKAKK